MFNTSSHVVCTIIRKDGREQLSAFVYILTGKYLLPYPQCNANDIKSKPIGRAGTVVCLLCSNREVVLILILIDFRSCNGTEHAEKSLKGRLYKKRNYMQLFRIHVWHMQ